MSTDFTTFYSPMPDPVKNAIDWLQDHPYFALLEYEFAGDLKGYQNSGVWVTVSLSGGEDLTRRAKIWQVTLDINSYGDTRKEALDANSLTLAALKGMKNHVFDDMVVTGFEGVNSPQDLTDPVNSNYRFVSDIDIILERR